MQYQITKLDLSVLIWPKSKSKKCRQTHQENSVHKFRYFRKKTIEDQEEPLTSSTNESNSRRQAYQKMNNIFFDASHVTHKEECKSPERISPIKKQSEAKRKKNMRTLIPNPELISKEGSPLFQKSPIQMKENVKSFEGTPVSMRESFRKLFSYENCRKSINHINPYTKQEYIHFRPREKRTIEQTYKQQILNSILKPCQIYQKQLSFRTTNRNSQRQDEKMRSLESGSMLRTWSHKIKRADLRGRQNMKRIRDQEGKIKPWDGVQYQDEYNF